MFRCGYEKPGKSLCSFLALCPPSRVHDQVLQTDSETRLDVMLEKFKSGVSHMSLVTKVTEVSDRDPMRETIGRTDST